MHINKLGKFNSIERSGFNMVFAEYNLENHSMWSRNQGCESNLIENFKQVLFCLVETHKPDKIEWLEISMYHAHID
jgi:hypothetical protein